MIFIARVWFYLSIQWRVRNEMVFIARVWFYLSIQWRVMVRLEWYLLLGCGSVYQYSGG